MFLFASKTHKKFPSQEDKIGWFPSQLQSEQSASRTTTILYNVRQNGRGKRPQIEPSVGRGRGREDQTYFSKGGGGGVRGEQTYFSKFPHQAMLEMLENIINSKTNPSALTKFPASSSEHLLFCQPARFLWGTDKVKNRFVVCPWVHMFPFLIWFACHALGSAKDVKHGMGIQRWKNSPQSSFPTQPRLISIIRTGTFFLHLQSSEILPIGCP